MYDQLLFRPRLRITGKQRSEIDRARPHGREAWRRPDERCLRNGGLNQTTAGELTTIVLIRERARVTPDHKNFEDESLLRIAHPRLA